MASGRRDYTWGFLSETGTEGRYGFTFTPAFTDALDPFEKKLVYNYQVPSGKRLVVNTVWVSCELRDVNRLYVYLKGQIVLDIYFADHFCFNFSDKNPPILTEGETVLIRCTNLVDLISQFSGGIIGNLETL